MRGDRIESMSISSSRRRKETIRNFKIGMMMSVCGKEMKKSKICGFTILYTLTGEINVPEEKQV